MAHSKILYIGNNFEIDFLSPNLVTISRVFIKVIIIACNVYRILNSCGF